MLVTLKHVDSQVHPSLIYDLFVHTHTHITCIYTHNRNKAIIDMKEFSTMDRSMAFTVGPEEGALLSKGVRSWLYLTTTSRSTRESFLGMEESRDGGTSLRPNAHNIEE